MKPEVARWLAKAAEDLDNARYLLDGARYAAASFHAQQAAEKALKAMLIERLGRFTRVHDLGRLAQELHAPLRVQESCELLAPAYAGSRYPDVGGDVENEDARILIQAAREVMNWVTLDLS